VGIGGTGGGHDTSCPHTMPTYHTPTGNMDVGIVGIGGIVGTWGGHAGA